MRRFLNYFLLITISLFPGALFGQEDQRPNIIIFIADDISYNDFGCYGHPVIRTPNIDRLAEAGLRFTNAFLTTSSCSPSRASIITGRYPHNTGAPELHQEMPPGQVPFPRLLREAGYYSAQAGKWHFGKPQPKHGDAMFGAFDRTGGHNADGGGPSGAERWADYVRERPKHKPFFMWFAAHDAHRNWDDDFVPVRYQASEVVVPAFLRDTPETLADLAAYYNEVSRFDHFVGEVVAVLKEQQKLNNTLIIVMADNGRPFPRYKTRLYDEGIKTPFVLHWPAGIQHRGAVSQSLLSSIDIAPTLLDVAGVKSPESFQGKSFRKVLDNPARPFRKYVFAEHNWHDFMAFERMVRSDRFLYIENGLPEQDNRGAIDVMGGGAGRALNEGWENNALSEIHRRIFEIPQPQKEFYDCQQDTLQVHNLVGTGQFAREQKKLAAILNTWRTETGDTQPDDLTRDWYDRTSNKPLAEKGQRGIMPGEKTNAHMIHRPGPF